MEAIERAILLGTAQRERLEAGDVEGYLAAEAAYNAACAAAGEDAANRDAAHALERLLALHGEIAAGLTRIGAETAAAMRQLRRQNAAANAYLAHPGGSAVHFMSLDG
ncbi:MAG: hypothetical protein HYX53_08030 [Chloroflexi bacterium]|nr:hypothetical protein [Chloroflexota bacterium]